MSVSLESASRLNALKSKIDTATGKSSDTLSAAVDNAIARGNIQTEELTFTPTAAGTIIMPSSGKYLSKVTVDPVPTMTKTVTPTESAQTYYPDAGKFFSAFTVEAAAASGKKVYTGTCNSYEYGTDYIDVPAVLSEDDIFIAFYEGTNSSTSVVIRFGGNGALMWYASSGMYGESYITSGNASVYYYGTTVEVHADNQPPHPYTWYLIQ